MVDETGTPDRVKTPQPALWAWVLDGRIVNKVSRWDLPGDPAVYLARGRAERIRPAMEARYPGVVLTEFRPALTQPASTHACDARSPAREGKAGRSTTKSSRRRSVKKGRPGA